MAVLAFLFIAIPALELALLIEVGSRIGTLPTFLLIVATGVAGAALARAQGLGVLARIQRELAEGRAPATALVDAAIVLVSAALLLTPGLLTDLVGLAGLIPPVRAILRRLGWKYVEHAIATRRIHVQTFSSQTGVGGPRAAGSARDGEILEPDYVAVPETDPPEADLREPDTRGAGPAAEGARASGSRGTASRQAGGEEFERRPLDDLDDGGSRSRAPGRLQRGPRGSRSARD